MLKKSLLAGVILAAALMIIGCSPGEETALEDEIILWTNSNVQGVQNDPQNDTVIVLKKACFITAIMDYHYFNDGEKPGTIELVSDSGEKFGPWTAVGRKGQGEVENAYWDVFPNIQLEAGEYTVIDSDPATWSQNDDSGNAGITEVKGTVIEE